MSSATISVSCVIPDLRVPAKCLTPIVTDKESGRRRELPSSPVQCKHGGGVGSPLQLPPLPSIHPKFPSLPSDYQIHSLPHIFNDNHTLTIEYSPPLNPWQPVLPLALNCKIDMFIFWYEQWPQFVGLVFILSILIYPILMLWLNVPASISHILEKRYNPSFFFIFE